MARTKQTARRSSGGKPPRAQLATKTTEISYNDILPTVDRKPHQNKPIFSNKSPLTIMKTAKQIPELEKYIVFGYIHCCEKEYIHSLPAIPSLIAYICLAFYYHKEYFINACEDIIISKDKRTITKIKNNKNVDNTSYLNQRITSNSNEIVKWIFKINHIAPMIRYRVSRPNNHYRPPRRVTFGLVSSQTMDIDTFISKPEFRPCYFINTTNSRVGGGTITILKEGSSHYNKRIEPRVSWDKYDWISIILNTRNGSLSVAKNNESAIKVVEDMVQGDDIKYKMGVSLCNIDDSVTLEEFTRVCC